MLEAAWQASYNSSDFSPDSLNVGLIPEFARRSNRIPERDQKVANSQWIKLSLAGSCKGIKKARMRFKP